MQTVPRLYETFQPKEYRLSLDLRQYPARTFSGAVGIIGNYSGGQLRFHAKELEIVSVSSNEKEISYSHDGDHLTLDDTNPAGERHITIEFTGKITDGMHGLYPCYFEVEGTKKELLATQFESHHAREVFPCIDEPEAKAIFNLALSTQSNVTVLSNMPTRSVMPEDDGITSIFEPTPAMSTYLLAFVVGELHKASAKTKSGVEVNVWATATQPTSMLAFPLDVAVRSIDFFDEYFGVPYPLPKADHVALPDFSSGAMENWGLITYREVALLADESTAQSSKEWVATVIAHETSHQWFGNLVTMKWWDDLWLNESFATVMEYIAVDAMFPSWNAWNNFASQETLSALRRDQLAGVQAVKTPVNHPDEISTLFDPSIVYAKGARLLKMLSVYIGEDAFRTGLAAYFKAHAYGNTTGDDLWQAFSHASGKDVGTFMQVWLTQSGLPLVTVQTTDDGYVLSQERFVVGDTPDDRRWPVPLASYNAELPELLQEVSISVTAKHSNPLLNRGNTAHFVSRYDQSALELILAALDNDELSTADRLAFLHESSLLARSGDIATASLVPILSHYKNEVEEPVWNIISMVIGDFKRFVEGSEQDELHLKNLSRQLALPLFEKLGLQKVDGEPEQDTKLRAIVLGLLTYAEYEPVISYGLESFQSHQDLSELESETRAIVCSIAAMHGSQEDFDRLLEAHEQTTIPELREDIVAGLTATKDPARVTTLLDRLTNTDVIKPQDITRWYISLLRNRHAREATWSWMVTNWTWIETIFKGDKSYDDYARYSANIIAGKDWLERYRDFFTPLASQPSLKRAVEIGITEITARTDWLERDQDTFRAALAQEIASS